MERTIEIGQHIKVVDEVGNLHDGLVTECWGQTVLKDGYRPTINVVFLSADAAKRDQYGRQSEHLSSCQHKTMTTAPGRFWYFPDE